MERGARDESEPEPDAHGGGAEEDEEYPGEGGDGVTGERELPEGWSLAAVGSVSQRQFPRKDLVREEPNTGNRGRRALSALQRIRVNVA